MLVVEVTISDILVDQVNETEFLKSIGGWVGAKSGILSRIVVLADGAQLVSNRLGVKGTIIPECDGETEITDEFFHSVLRSIGLAIEAKQNRFVLMSIKTEIGFASVGNDKVKKYLITNKNREVCRCDTPEQVGEYLQNHAYQLVYLRVFDNGVEMFSKQYLK